MPPIVATVVSSRLATYGELSTCLGLEDMWNLLEIYSVNLYNERLPPLKD